MHLTSFCLHSFIALCIAVRDFMFQQSCEGGVYPTMVIPLLFSSVKFYCWSFR